MKAWTEISWGYNVLSQTKAPPFQSLYETAVGFVSCRLLKVSSRRLRRLGSRQCSCERRSLLYFCTFDCLGVAQWPLIPMPYIYTCICSTEKKAFCFTLWPFVYSSRARRDTVCCRNSSMFLEEKKKTLRADTHQSFDCF